MTTSLKSFSELLQDKLDEDTAKAEAEKKAKEQLEWLVRVNAIAAWLRLVFNDESFELLGYKLKLRLRSRDNDHFLTVYVRVGNLVFGLEIVQDVGRHKAYFGICALRNARSGVSSQLFRLQQMYKENNGFNQLEIDVDFAEDSKFIIKLGTAQGEMMRAKVREEIVAATVNVLRRRPDLGDAQALKSILLDLPKHKRYHSLTEQSVSPVPSGPFVLDEAKYLASLDPEILTMPIYELIKTKDFVFEEGERQKCLGALRAKNITTVTDVLTLCEEDFWGDPVTSTAVRTIINALAELDLELVPPNGAPRLSPGIPKTVDRLLSGIEWAERPRNCLLRRQIRTTSELIQNSKGDLLSITNFGQKSLDIVKEALAQYGLNLKQE